MCCKVPSKSLTLVCSVRTGEADSIEQFEVEEYGPAALSSPGPAANSSILIPKTPASNRASFSFRSKAIPLSYLAILLRVSVEDTGGSNSAPKAMHCSASAAALQPRSVRHRRIAIMAGSRLRSPFEVAMELYCNTITKNTNVLHLLRQYSKLFDMLCYRCVKRLRVIEHHKMTAVWDR